MKKDILKSLFYAFICVLFPVVGNVYIQMREITNEEAIIKILGFVFFVASVIGYVLYAFKYRNKKENLYDGKNGLKIVIFFIPIIIHELIGLIPNISEWKYDGMLYLFFFTLFVGIAEELFFRGIIFNILRKYSIKKAALISALIFGIFHLANALGGQNTLYTVTQICYAFLFGLTCSLIYYYTNNLIPAILWHFIHDFISMSTGDVINLKAIIIVGIQVLILLIYSIYMLKNIKDDKIKID